MRVLALCVVAACGRIDFDARFDATNAPPLTISRLWIYEPRSNAMLQDVTTGGVFDILAYPDGICVLVEVAGAGSVEFLRNGQTRVENVPPFSSGGDIEGNFAADLDLYIGPNIVRVTAFELTDRGGAVGPPLTVPIELRLPVANTAVIRIGIINNDNTEFMEIADGGSYSAAILPADADLRIETDPAFIGSVLIGGTALWDGFIDSYPPYTALGVGSNFTPTPGMQYSISAVPYSLGNAHGQAGAPLSMTFTVTQ